MTLKVSDLILSARTKFNDRLSDHFTTDDLSSQVQDGENARFKLLNRNIVQEADGAPVDLKVFISNAPVTVDSVDQVSGIAVLDSAPQAGDQPFAEYYFVLVEDDAYLEFAKDASQFVGTTPTFTSATDDVQFNANLKEAASLYMAAQAAFKMANLSSWYYTANAGNKGFNKDQIAKKFQDTGTSWQIEAEKKRDDVYSRFSQRLAPAAAQSHQTLPFSRWQPRR